MQLAAKAIHPRLRLLKAIFEKETFQGIQSNSYPRTKATYT